MLVAWVAVGLFQAALQRTRECMTSNRALACSSRHAGKGTSKPAAWSWAVPSGAMAAPADALSRMPAVSLNLAMSPRSGLYGWCSVRLKRTPCMNSISCCTTEDCSIESNLAALARKGLVSLKGHASALMASASAAGLCKTQAKRRLPATMPAYARTHTMSPGYTRAGCWWRKYLLNSTTADACSTSSICSAAVKRRSTCSKCRSTSALSSSVNACPS